MADAPKLLSTDTLKQGYPKINQAIDNANEALNESSKQVGTSKLADNGVTERKLYTTVMNRVTKAYIRVVGKLYYRIIDRDTIEIIAPKYSLGYFAGGGDFKYINTITENIILNKYESLVFDITKGTTYVETRTLIGTTIDKGAFASDDKLLLVSHITYDRIVSNVELIELEDDTNNIVFSKTANEFTVYTKSSTGTRFVGYSFRYTEKPYISGDKTSNVKLWSFKKAAEYKKNTKFSYELVRDFYNDATQDLMIRENKVNDYIGGAAHGDEVLQSVRIFVDDREIDPKSVTSFIGKEMKMIQTTYLYRDTSTTNGELIHVATARKMHVVNKGGYSIDVSVEFHAALSLRECQIGSMSMNRTDKNGNIIFKEAIFGGYLTSEDLTAVATEFNKYENQEDIFVLGNDISINWDTKRKENISGNKTWINNSAATLTKVYSSYIPNDYVTKVGEVFRQRTHYFYNVTVIS
ncbi:hypothetical protein CN272_22235 [Bacillus anthracis]|nr:hypothetical protein CN272_22235 [Bacillus anthracis]